MPKESKDKSLGALQRLAMTLQANREELGYLEGPVVKFLALVGQIQELAKEQAVFIAGKQETSQKLQALLGDTQRLATVIRATLKEHYGIRSEKLAEFGIQPFRGVPRKTKPGPEEDPEAQAPSPRTEAPAKSRDSKP
jgi:hypothetical protein